MSSGHALTERSKELHRELAIAVGAAIGQETVAVFPLMTGGGMYVCCIDLSINTVEQTRQIWLTRDGFTNGVNGTVGWLMGFYDFAADEQDEGVVVQLILRHPDDPGDIAQTVAGIVKRMGIGLYDGPGS